MHAAASRGNLPHHQLIYPPSLRYLPVWTLGALPRPPRPPPPLRARRQRGLCAMAHVRCPDALRLGGAAARSAAPTRPGSQGRAAAARALLCAASRVSGPLLSRPGCARWRAVP